MTHTIHVTEVIKAPVNKIWDILRDFNGLAAFHPAILASRIEQGENNEIGCIRHLTIASGYVREELLKLDDKTFAFEYAIIDGTLPVLNYRAGVQLKPGDNQTTCEWWADFDVINHAERDELIEMISEHVFRAGFQAIAQLV